MLADDKQIGLLGVTRETTMLARECYLEYLWIAPDFRRAGADSMLLRAVLGHLRDSGVQTVWLYILNGNHGPCTFIRDLVSRARMGGNRCQIIRQAAKNA